MVRCLRRRWLAGSGLAAFLLAASACNLFSQTPVVVTATQVQPVTQIVPITQLVEVTVGVPVTQVVEVTATPAPATPGPTLPPGKGPRIALPRLEVAFTGQSDQMAIGRGCPGVDARGTVPNDRLVVQGVDVDRQVTRVIVAGDNFTDTWEWPCESAWELLARDLGGGTWEIFIARANPHQVYTVVFFYHDNTMAVGMARVPEGPAIILERLSVSYLGQDGQMVIGRGCPGEQGQGAVVDIHLRVEGVDPARDVARVLVAGESGGVTWESPCLEAWELVARDAGGGIWDVFLAPSETPPQIYTVIFIYRDDAMAIGMVRVP